LEECTDGRLKAQAARVAYTPAPPRVMPPMQQPSPMTPMMAKTKYTGQLMPTQVQTPTSEPTSKKKKRKK
jgi:hypothetical protein